MMIPSVLLACASIFLLVGCTVNHLPDVVAQRPESYRFRNTVEGIVVAADPYLEEQRIVEYFGTNLLSEGILPVHLVIRNNSGSTYMFDPRDVMCSFAFGRPEMPDETAARSQATQDRRGTESQTPESHFYVPAGFAGAHLAAQTGVAPPVFGAPALLLGGAFVAWAVDYEVQKNEVSYKSISRKQISEKSLFGGETHSGFVYFKDKDKEKLRNIDRLVVRMIQKPENRALAVIVEIKENADRRRYR